MKKASSGRTRWRRSSALHDQGGGGHVAGGRHQGRLVRPALRAARPGEGFGNGHRAAARKVPRVSGRSRYSMDVAKASLATWRIGAADGLILLPHRPRLPAGARSPQDVSGREKPRTEQSEERDLTERTCSLSSYSVRGGLPWERPFEGHPWLMLARKTRHGGRGNTSGWKTNVI